MEYRWYEAIELVCRMDKKLHSKKADVYMMFYDGRPCWFYKKNDQFFKSVSFDDEMLYVNVYERYEPLPAITRGQHFMLSSIHDAYHYIGRDSDGTLGVFSSEPYRMSGNWTIYSDGISGLATRLPLKKDALEFIKGDDNKAYKIKDLLRGHSNEV